MTSLCGGVHNEARVPEFRLPAGSPSVRSRNVSSLRPLPHEEKARRSRSGFAHSRSTPTFPIEPCGKVGPAGPVCLCEEVSQQLFFFFCECFFCIAHSINQKKITT